MRIITGSAKGKKLIAPEGLDTRPTTDSVKEAMFSAVQFEIRDRVVLDLFAGSGQLGIEALSRGAKKAYFADISAKAVEVIRLNLEKAELSDKAEVKRLPDSAFLRTASETFDIAFLDPPYGKGHIQKAMKKLIEKMSAGGVIVCEHEKELVLPETAGSFEVDKVYRHGGTSITVYRGRE